MEALAWNVGMEKPSSDMVHDVNKPRGEDPKS